LSTAHIDGGHTVGAMPSSPPVYVVDAFTEKAVTVLAGSLLA